MAEHITSVASSSIPKLSKDEFYARCMGGDLVFCAGREPVSEAIDFLSGSIFSHVLMIWLPWANCPEWLDLESTIQKNVHVGRFGDYMDKYHGDLVLCRRTVLTQAQILQQLNTGFSLLDYRYDFIEEGSIAVRSISLFSKLPAIKPAKELYCSGLLQAIATDTVPFKTYGTDWNTPEQLFIDPTVEAVGAYLRSDLPTAEEKI